VEATGLVIEQLALVHACKTSDFVEALQSWDYDRELLDSAESTVELYRAAFFNGLRPGNRPMLRPLERVTRALPVIRRALAAFIGATVLHGDAHTGNAIIRRSGESNQAVLHRSRSLSFSAQMRIQSAPSTFGPSRLFMR